MISRSLRRVVHRGWSAFPKGGTWTLALRVANLLTTLFTIAVFTRALGPSAFGSWAVLTALVLAMAAIDLGLGPALIRRAGMLSVGSGAASVAPLVRAARRQILRRSGVALALAGATASIVATHVDVELIGLDGLELAIGLVVAGGVACALAMLGLASRARIGLGETGPSSRLQLWGCLAQVPLVLLINFTGGPLSLFVAISFASQLIGFSLDSIVVARRGHPGQPMVALDRQLRRQGLGYMVIVSAGAAGFGLDAIVTGAVLGPVEAGLVALAARIILTPQSLVAAAFMPAWAEYARAERLGDTDALHTIFRRTTVGASAACALTCTGAAVMARPVGRVIAGPSYELDTLLIWTTALAGTVLGSAAAVALGLNGLGLVRVQVRIAVMSGTANLALSVVLCRAIGVSGAPLATGIVHSFLGFVPAWLAVSAKLRRLKAAPNSGG